MDNFDDKLEAGIGELKELMNQIPGYKGYTGCAERREADAAQREFLSRRLAEIKRELQNVQEECLADGNLEAVEPCDRVGNVIDRLIERVRHASRGYVRFFEAHKVKEELLNRVYEFDMALLVNLNAIEEGVKGLYGAIGGNFNGAVRAVKSSVEELDAKLSERERILKGIE